MYADLINYFVSNLFKLLKNTMNKIKALFNATSKSTTSEKNFRPYHPSDKQSHSEKGQAQVSFIQPGHSKLTKSQLPQSLSNQGQIIIVNPTLKSNPKSLWGSFCIKVNSLFEPIYWLIYVLISIICSPIYMVAKLLKSFYGLIKHLNPIMIVNFIKPVFSSIYTFVSYLSNKIKNLIRNQHRKGWPIFKFIRDLNSQQVLDENDYDILLSELKKQIQSLQITKSQIGKDITLLEQTTLKYIEEKEKQIQNRNSEIQELKQENQQIQIKFANETEKVQQLKVQKLKYQKLIETQRQNMRITLQEIDNKHKQVIIEQKQYYQAQFMNLRQQKQILRQKLQQKIQILKQSFQQLITKKDKKINDYLNEINHCKEQIMNLREQLYRVIKQHQKEIKELIQNQQFHIKRSPNKNKKDSQTQTVQIINHEHQNQIMFHPQLMKRSSIESQQQSQSMIKFYNSEKDFKLGKTKTSIGQNYQSQRKTHSNDQIPNYLSFSNRFNDQKHINMDKTSQQSNSSQSSYKKINSSIKIVRDFPQLKSQSLNISHTIYMNLSDLQSSKKSYSDQEIQVKSIKDIHEQKQKSNFCFKFFIVFICLWSIYMCQKLYQLWNILKV